MNHPVVSHSLYLVVARKLDISVSRSLDEQCETPITEVERTRKIIRIEAAKKGSDGKWNGNDNCTNGGHVSTQETELAARFVDSPGYSSPRTQPAGNARALIDCTHVTRYGLFLEE